MKKFVAIILGIVLLAAAGYAASAFFIGKQVETALAEPQKQIASTPFVKVARHDYKRGVFTSTQTVTFELLGEMLKAMEETRQQAGLLNPQATIAPRGELPPFRFTVTSRIVHGPLPGLDPSAAAMVDSELEVDERFRPALAKVLGDRKVLTAHTVIRYDGSGDSTVTSPAFVATVAEGGSPVRLTWDGFQGTVKFATNLESYSLKGDAPKFEAVDDKGGRMIIAGMRMEAQSRKAFADDPLLYVGSQKFTIAEASVSGPVFGGKAFALKQLAYDVDVPLKGEFIDILARFSVREATLAEQNYGPAHYDFALRHLHARTFSQMQQTMMQIYSDPAASAAGANPAAVLGPLTGPALKLLQYNPEITLDRVSFHTAHGEVVITGRAKFVDIKPEDIGQPPVLLAKIDAGADIALPEALLMTQFGPAPQTVEAAQAQMQMRGQQIAALLEQGYIYRDGVLIKSKLEFRNGQFTVNGLPFDPMALQQRQAPPVAATPRRGPPKLAPVPAQRPTLR